MVRLILTHPKLWRAASDDHSGDPAAYHPPDDRSIHYVLAFSDALDLMGLFVFHPQSPECFAAHVALLPSAWGPGSERAAQLAFRYMFRTTRATRIVGAIAQSNRLAIAYAKRAGMKRYGTSPASFLRGGRLIGQVLLGISKE
jgi:RimJ/RimL family protein N-acetyltransferase